MVVQELRRTAVDAARNEAERCHRRLEAECQSLCSTCAGESSLSALCFHLVIVPGCRSIVCLGLSMEALSNLESRMATEQRAQEATTKLAVLTISGQAVCDIMLGPGQADTQLVLCFVVVCLLP